MVPDPRRRPVVAVTAVALLVEALTALRFAARLATDEWPVLYDSVIFEYHGWWLVRGERLYIDLWEVKPPVAFEVTAALALVAPDVRTYHVLAVGFGVAATVATCTLAAVYVRDRTTDALAAVAAGLAPLALAGFVSRGLMGFKAKPLVAALVLAALVAWGRDRPVLAGVAAGLGAGTWQLAAAVPVVLVADALRRGERRTAARVAAGTLVAAVLVVAPVVAWGAVPAMVAETVLVPLLSTGGSGTPEGRVVRALGGLGVAVPVVALGAAGHALAARAGGREWLPAATLTAWFGGLLLLDYDAAPDLFVLVPLAALGVGYVVAARPRVRGVSLRRVFVAGVLLLAAVAVGTLGVLPGTVGPRATLEPYDTGRTLAVAEPYNQTERQYLFWNEVPPSSCRLFGAVTQRDVVRAAEVVPPDESWRTAPCGQFEPLFDAVVEKYS